MDEFTGFFKVLRVVIGVFFLSRYIAKSESKFMKKIRQWLKKSRAVNLDAKCQEIRVWKQLKEFLEYKKYRFGAFESEKTCEVQLEIIEDYYKTFYFTINNNELHLRVKIFDEYPIDKATDIFVLASHLNNVLKTGKIKVNVKYKYVEYYIRKNIVLFLLEDNELLETINTHHSTSITLFYSFFRLIENDTPPVEIISDILKANEEE